MGDSGQYRRHFEAAGTTQRTPWMFPFVLGPTMLPIRARKLGKWKAAGYLDTNLEERPKRSNKGT